MDERFLVLLTKIVVLLILFPDGQLGREFKFQCAALVFPSAVLPFQGVESPGILAANPPLSEVESPGLSTEEVKALNLIVSSLEFVPWSTKKSVCDENPFRTNVTIDCTPSNNDTDHQRHITKIIMEDARLTGKIPAYVSRLTRLQTLDLSNNKLHGSIPDKLGDLSNLVELDLSQNQLTGTIPLSLGNLKKLKELNLEQNLLSGKIPPTLGNLSSLRELRLWCNQLSGDIPPELGDLSQLQMLILDQNGLTGKPPPQLGKLSNLQYLWLTSNKLDGALPKEYEKLANLKLFDVGGNNLRGAIPLYIANWVSLTTLNLIGNNFEGKLPPEIFNMTNLEHLWVTDLKNPGMDFPKSADLENIETLILRNCNINGVIPSYIAKWSATSLSLLDLSFNNLIGGVPDDFKNKKLAWLFLTGNMLNGTFPTWIYETVRIMGDLSYNNFSFRDEPQMDKSMNLTDPSPTKINIEPRNSTFIQEIMDKHCDGKKSKYHSLFINAGGEQIKIGRNLYEADSSTSSFNVSPAYNWAYSCNGYFLEKSTNSSDFLWNKTCGVTVNSEEASLYSNARLCPQSLTYYGFCLHKGNYNVKLHFSEIIFSKDEDLSNSGKRIFDIYIQRELKLKDFNIKERAGGPNRIWMENFTVDVPDNFLEIKLFWNGKGSQYMPTTLNGPLISAISVTPNFKVGGLSKKGRAGIVIAAVSAPLILLAAFMSFMWRIGWLGDRELRETCVELRGMSYTLKEIKDATRNFSTRNEIGTGRFGTVYKADIGDQIVAVKKLSPQAKHVIDQIGTELYVQEKPLNHDNLVELLGCCSKRDLHLLIYEHMENGSLQRALFDPVSEVQLDWPKRVSICLGIAKGLNYLHNDNPNREIIHRNIKPSNVLLDGSLNAKVADLGLAKIYDEEDPYKFIQEKGTSVYTAPEYAMRKAITDKVDVFSFGILLLEIVSGQTNAKYEENGETVFLLDTAIVLQTKGKLLDLVDKKLSSYNWQQANQILELAMQCIDQSPTLRPTMSRIVSVLQHISQME